MVLIPILGLAQIGIAGNTKSFYAELGQRDALNEQQLVMVSDDDYKDFWKDQTHFESLLAAQNPEGYQIYLNSKGFAYRLHQKICTTACEHSEYYLNKAAFYAINGQEDIEVVYASKIKKPQIKD
ncbi:hypothetical protein [Croceitalea rosinachiae]|uniref:Uncharacterized protein n=1 Tax=Croceitalea rosinachiae TaxID=3075596 RepID=A0ABU3A6V6_9FLAO|nr:hypothetical protein [Croceitalea sp. F388]MDT0605899.1 hypothetical protein [Croceitalea sp. F388]